MQVVMCSGMTDVRSVRSMDGTNGYCLPRWAGFIQMALDGHIPPCYKDTYIRPFVGTEEQKRVLLDLDFSEKDAGRWTTTFP